jgi:hypothetical protein
VVARYEPAEAKRLGPSGPENFLKEFLILGLARFEIQLISAQLTFFCARN